MIKNKNAEKITIIIPVYNVEDYLKRCLNTVVAQSYKNLEIILVDDGSNDDSLIICKEFEAKDSRIRVFSQTNQGVSAARNTGLDAASGEYIAFVDSDDYIHLNMFERLYSLINNYNADLSACFIRGCWNDNYNEPVRNDIEISTINKVDPL